MDLMDIDEDTFIDKNLRMEGIVTEGETAALPDSDTPLRPAERKRFLHFDFEALPRMKLSSGHVTVCVGLLCVFLLAANIGQLIYHTSENVQRDRLQSSHDALTAQRDQLERRLSEVTREKEQLLQSYNQLTSNTSLWEDRERLLGSNNTLLTEILQLQTSYISLAPRCFKTAKRFTEKMVNMAVEIRSLPCQSGWRKFGDSCYIVSTVDKNWTLSREDCIAKGADLAVINSRKEQVFVNGLLTSDAWIGLTDSVKEGTWTWVDGTPITTTFWGDSQPNSHGGNQDCVENVKKSSGDGEWNDFDCSAKQKFICEQ